MHGVALVRTGQPVRPRRQERTLRRDGGGDAQRRHEIEDRRSELDEELENIAGAVESEHGRDQRQRDAFPASRKTTDAVLGDLQGRADRVRSSGRTRSTWRWIAVRERHRAAQRRCAMGSRSASSPHPLRARHVRTGGRSSTSTPRVESHRATICSSSTSATYFPKNIMLAVLGRFFDARNEGQAGEAVRRLDRGAAPVPPFPPVTAKPRPGIYLAPKSRT